jgi:hypothetical protein
MNDWWWRRWLLVREVHQRELEIVAVDWEPDLAEDSHSYRATKLATLDAGILV